MATEHHPPIQFPCPVKAKNCTGLSQARFCMCLTAHFVGIRCSTSSTIPAMTAHYGIFLFFFLLLLLLFIFNIYVLAVVITVISFVRQVIKNDQRLTEYFRLYISNTFLSILAVPNKGVFLHYSNISYYA